MTSLEPGFFYDEVARLSGALSVYVHVPFCKEQCTFCGCNMVVAGRQEAGNRFLAALEQQLRALPGPERRPVVRLHLGGGTPTWLNERQLERLFLALAQRFDVLPGAEVGVEVDPDVTTDGQVHRLAELGVTRLSIGVQDVEPAVLEAVNRPQVADRVEAILQIGRSHGMRSLNLDLMYGLPHQTPESWERTLARVRRMAPDRIAAFGYAHVPWLKAHQRQLTSDDLPGPSLRAELWQMTQDRLAGWGFLPIGLDHFATPDDALAMALSAGTLRRDFMGYTDRPRAPMIGLGPSAISELPDRFVQAPVKRGPWYRVVESGGEPMEKGLRLTLDDVRRGWVIEQLMCTLRVDNEAYEARFGRSLVQDFPIELARARALLEDGVATWDGEVLQVSPWARLLVRNVAMLFDGYLEPAAPENPRFSSTV
jgi:oxygen-independent coproporphyrinogen-3 oxidase